MINDILARNRAFLENQEYEPFKTDKFPNRKLAIVTCMDTRLTELLPAALGLKNGDAKIIKNAGAIISHPFGSVVRSLLIAIYELGVTDIMIVGHTDCGVCGMDSGRILAAMEKRGISKKSMETARYFGNNLESWLSGFSDIDKSVNASVELLKNHPLIPEDVTIYGYIMDSVTGGLRLAGNL